MIYFLIKITLTFRDEIYIHVTQLCRPTNQFRNVLHKFYDLFYKFYDLLPKSHSHSVMR